MALQSWWWSYRSVSVLVRARCRFRDWRRCWCWFRYGLRCRFCRRSFRSQTSICCERLTSGGRGCFRWCRLRYWFYGSQTSRFCGRLTSCRGRLTFHDCRCLRAVRCRLCVVGCWSSLALPDVVLVKPPEIGQTIRRAVNFIIERDAGTPLRRADFCRTFYFNIFHDQIAVRVYTPRAKRGGQTRDIRESCPPKSVTPVPDRTISIVPPDAVSDCDCKSIKT